LCNDLVWRSIALLTKKQSQLLGHRAVETASTQTLTRRRGLKNGR
jgi:hypothetical protein